jgi:hypothetical protein
MADKHNAAEQRPMATTRASSSDGSWLRPTVTSVPSPQRSTSPMTPTPNPPRCRDADERSTNVND